jgi:hypothetical protein
MLSLPSHSHRKQHLQFAEGGTGEFGNEGTEAERRAEQGPTTEPRNGTKDNYGQRRLHVNSSPTTEDMCMKGLVRQSGTSLYRLVIGAPEQTHIRDGETL